MSNFLLKNIYDDYFFSDFTEKLNSVSEDFCLDRFNELVFDKDWDNRELKSRMKHLCIVLEEFLNSEFEKACKQIISLTELISLKQYKYGSLAYMFLPDYIESNGLEYFEISMSTLEKITEFTSCEFAVRPFIIHNPTKAFDILYTWSNNENFHIRRLSSEGCRPLLPWAIALKKLKNDPSPILPILENLKNDSEDYVYRSVANNLNDISKHHPNLVIDIAKKWIGKSKNTDWLVKHALRTLLKEGNQQAMLLFGYANPKSININSLKIQNGEAKIGESISFSFELSNSEQSKIRLEYAIYFLRKNGNLNKKVFKISEKKYDSNSKITISKKHSFKIISTRKYYPGIQKLSIIVNGIEKVIQTFNLTKND